MLDDDRQKLSLARKRFRHLMVYTLAAAVLMVAAALFYLSLYTPLTATLVGATTAGVFLSVLLGAGLMAMGFLSSNSGHDEKAGGWTAEPGRNDGDELERFCRQESAGG